MSNVIRFFSVMGGMIGKIEVASDSDADIQAAADAWVKTEYPTYAAIPSTADSKAKAATVDRVTYTVEQVE